jgi:hypothetical protein
VEGLEPITIGIPMTKVTLEIEIVYPSRSGWIATMRVVTGRVEDDMRDLACVETGAKYRIENFALGGGMESVAGGSFTVRLARTQPGMEPDVELAVGMHLVSDHADVENT